MIKKIFSITILLSIAITSLTAQTSSDFNQQIARSRGQKPIKEESTSKFDARRLTFGGGFGLQFGDYTLVNVSPQVGYNFSDKFNAGVGLSYSYYKDDYRSNFLKYEERRHYASFNLYARVYPIENIVLMVQPEASRVWYTAESQGFGQKYSESKFVPSVVVGGGLRFGPMTAMLKYDLVQDSYSPYGDTVFYSIGYTFGL